MSPGAPAGAGRRVRPVGRRAVLVECAGLDDVLAVRAHLLRAPLEGQQDVQAGAESVLVLASTDGAARRIARELARLEVTGGTTEHGGPAAAPPDPGREVVLDVVYDGPDLHEVARRLAMSRDAVVRAHTGADWVAAFGGFAPGFMYLAADATDLVVTRRSSPRTAVPAGAVALAAGMSAVYPRRSPGGWQLIGTTSAVLWDVDRDPPALVVPGDRVRFRSVRQSLRAGPTAITAPGRSAAVPRPGGARSSRDAPGPHGRAALTVLSPGLLSVVEDLGRPGHLDLGVGRSGAADRGAAARANRLVGNGRQAAVVETVLGGLRVEATGDHVVAVTGAPAPLSVLDRDGSTTATPPTEEPFTLPDGHTLVLGTPPAGLRSYLAVRGGVAVAPVLGSRSTDVLSGIGPAPVQSGAVLPVGPPPGSAVGLAEAPPLCPDGPVTLRVTFGPREDWFTQESRDRLVAQRWTVSEQSDRVGVRLGGQPLVRSTTRELPSEGTVAGAIQVPPSGLPVVLLADHPVSGGYPVIAVVDDADRDRIAQVRPGDHLRFTL